MGFFSRIKKLWGSDAPPQPEQTQTIPPGQDEPASSAPAHQAEAADVQVLTEQAAVPARTEPAEVQLQDEPAKTENEPDEILARTEQTEPVNAQAQTEATEAPTQAEPSENLARTEPVHVQSEPVPTILPPAPGPTPSALSAGTHVASAPAAADSPATDDAPDAAPVPETAAAVTPAATSPQPDHDEQEPASDPASTPQPAPATVDSVGPAQPQPAAKSSGWRRLFGLKPKEEKAPAEPGPRPAPPAPAPEAPTPEAAKPEILFQEKPAAKDALAPWQQALLQDLRAAEPRLSTWMGHILDGVDKRGETLWERLRFLFAQLDVPSAESQDFISRFDRWLDDMEYDHVDEFRSELQYRMALALELEDEEDERNRLFLKLSAGLGKTREQLTMRIDQLLSMAGGYDDAFWEELEEILLMADVGVNATQELLKRLKVKVRKAGARDSAVFKSLLKEELAAVFKEPKAPKIPQGPEVVLMIGVNGAGKTTTIAKLAHRAQMQGRKVLVAAGDTFRAAAIEQLQVWSKRVGAGFYAKAHGSDPAAVAFEAVDHALKEGYDLVFVDTAGRLQTKHNLMEELKKINRVLGKKLDGAPHRTVLVLDATTGQNALSQVKLFSQASPVDEVILTKLDGTAKGGIIVAIALEHGIPISFVGLGEKMEDLRPFSGQEFANALFD